MKGLAIRALIAVVTCYLIWLLVPLVLSAIGFTVDGNILAIFKIVLAICALYYIVWGQTPALPPAS